MTADVTKLIIAGVIAYALGNINPSIIISRLFYGIDIRKEGSGNAGTTNTIRVIGLTAGLICLAIDILKGFIAVTIGYNMGEMYGSMVAFAFVVLGHCFPALWGFKGGKGVACAFGAALAMSWPSAIAAFFISAICLAVTRRMSIGSIAAVISFPALVWYYDNDYFYFAIGMAAFLLLMHVSNIIRLSRGEEKALTIGHKARKGEEPEEAETTVTDNTQSAIAVEEKPLTEAEIIELGADAQVIEDLESGESPIAADATKEPGLVGAQTQEAVRPEPEPVDYYAGVEIPDLGDSKCKIAVIGNGSFGTAIANLLVYKGHDVTLYGRNKEAIKLMKEHRMNDHYLPYVILSDRIQYTSDLKKAVKGKAIVVFAVPTQQFRSVSSRCAGWLDDGVIVVNLAKGIEQNTLMRLSEIAAETLPSATYVALSGPSHAEEIVRNFPAGVVVASKNKAAAEYIQDVFMSDQFRVYTQEDMAGVEIAGAVKNVIAITTGISDGMKLGSNARAALMTRAIHEIKRLGTAMGANPETFSGLSGIGDLIVTCSTNLSRNRRCGLLIGLGLEAEDAVKRVGSVVEGYYTAEAVCDLAEKYDVEMPICRVTNNVLKGELEPEKALKLLMSRSKKDELQ